ncbi:MAG: glycosyltransferase [Pirellulales bacterium]
MRKILILAPMFFPDPQVGGIRLTQWARHLPEFGWSPFVLTRHLGYTATPEALAETVHPAVRLDYLGPRIKTPEPTDSPSSSRGDSLLRGMALQLLDVVSVPDVLVWKWRSVSAQAVSIARQWQPDVVLSSSPSHSIHVAGRRVAEAIGVPWVADFRDPYLIDYRFKPHGAKWLSMPWHRRFEQGIYRDAALCIHAIPLHARWASRRFPFARDKIRILTNGIPSELLDEEMIPSADRPDVAASQRVSIRAAGVLQKSSVQAIAIALQQLLNEGIDAEFRHVGHARGANAAVPNELRDRFQLRGPVSHEEALREIAGADILLNYLDEQRAKVSGLSSKLFEYLATGRPIVAVNPTLPDRQLIGRLPWCWCLRNPASAELAAALRQAITMRAKPSEGWLSAFRERYNRRTQTRQLAQWLDELLPAASVSCDLPATIATTTQANPLLRADLQ